MRLGKIVNFFLACIVFSMSFIAMPVTSEEGVVTLQDEVVINVDSTNLRFSPSEVTIDEGQTVRFFWDGELLAHNAVERNGVFDSGNPERNVDYSFTFDIGMAGEYEFVCEPHESVNMIGKITVNSAPMPIDDVEVEEVIEANAGAMLNPYFILTMFGVIGVLLIYLTKQGKKV